MFDWDDLKYFLELSRRGKLVLAARHLKVDHTTVSRRVSALEQSIGSKLVEKTEKGYRLTAAGEKLLPLAEEIETKVRTAQDRLAQENTQLGGAVRIGAPDGFGSFFLAPRLPRIRDKHPQLEIELVALPRYLSLSKREADLAVTLARPTTGRLFSRKLTDYQLGLYASRDYLDNNAPIMSKKDLKEHKLIGYIDDLIFAPELRYMEKVGKELTAGFRSANLIAQRQATIGGAGIAVLPRFMVRDDPRLRPVLAEDVRLVRSLWLLVHEDMRDLARIREVGDFIQSSVKAERRLFIED